MNKFLKYLSAFFLAIALVGLVTGLVSNRAGAVVAPPSPTDQESVLLIWDYEDGDVPAAKFKVYVGTVSGVYDRAIETDNSGVRSKEIELSTGTYYFVVTAVSADGIESLPSNEATYTTPRRPNSPTNLRGNRITIIFD